MGWCRTCAGKWEAGAHSPALFERPIRQRNMGAETPLMAALPAGGSSYPSQESVPQVGTGLDLLTMKEAGNQLWFPPSPSVFPSPSLSHPHKDTFSF